jgi:hypothetical protein
VVFVGIGDVADYVRKRLEEAIADIGNVDNIRVVSPSINQLWTDSKWAELVPTLDPEHRLEEAADAFLDKLGAAYVLVALADVSTGFQEEPALAEPFDAACSGLKKHDALTVLSWARRAGVIAEAGSSVLASPTMATALTALGKLVGVDFRIERDSIIAASGGPLEILVAIGTQPASRLRREAEIRLEHHLGNGVEPRFVVAGGIGWPAEGQEPRDDIMGAGVITDVLDGPLNATPSIIRAESVVSG